MYSPAMYTIAVTGDGECHSIEAIGEPIEMIALILYTT